MSEIMDVRDFLGGFEKTAQEMGDKLSGITGTLQLDFTEDNNGCWYIEFEDGKVSPLVEGTAEDPTMTITGAYETFYLLKTGQLKQEEVIPTGKIKLGGDTGFTMRLMQAGLV